MRTGPIDEHSVRESPPRFVGGPYFLATAAVIGSALLRLAVDSFAHDEAPLLFFAFGVVIAALYGGFSAGIAATILSIPVSDYLFVQPRHTFFAYDPPSQSIMLIAFALLGVLLCGIIERLNRAREHLRRTALDLSQANAQLVENERRLAKSEERFRMATEAANEAIWEWNLETGPLCGARPMSKIMGVRVPPSQVWGGGKITFTRKSANRLSKVFGQRWTEQAMPGHRNTVFAERMGRGHIFMIGLALRETRAGRACRAIGAMLDVTETVLARKALQESEVRLTTLAAMVPEILYTAMPNGMADYVSKRFADYSGLPVEDIARPGMA